MVFLALNKIADIFENRAFNSHRMDLMGNAYLLKGMCYIILSPLHKIIAVNKIRKLFRLSGIVFS